MKVPDPPVNIESVSTKAALALIGERLKKFGDVAYAVVNNEHGMSLISKDGDILPIPALKCGQGSYAAYLIARTLELAGFGKAGDFRPDALFKDKLTVTRTEEGVRLQSERTIG